MVITTIYLFFTTVLIPKHLPTLTCNVTILKYLNYRKEGIKKIINKVILLILEKIRPLML